MRALKVSAKSGPVAGSVGSERPADPLLALVLLLSLVAGATDTIGFLGLNGLFMAHITGNLVVLAARMVGQGQHELAQILSVPVFVTVLALTRLLAVVLRRYGRPSLAPLLLLHFLLLLGFLALCLRLTGRFDPEAPCPVIAGMCGVAAMAVQNALVQVSLPGAPATAVMTTNLTRFVGELVDDLTGHRSPYDPLARAEDAAGGPRIRCRLCGRRPVRGLVRPARRRTARHPRFGRLRRRPPAALSAY